MILLKILKETPSELPAHVENNWADRLSVIISPGRWNQLSCQLLFECVITEGQRKGSRCSVMAQAFPDFYEALQEEIPCKLKVQICSETITICKSVTHHLDQSPRLQLVSPSYEVWFPQGLLSLEPNNNLLTTSWTYQMNLPLYSGLVAAGPLEFCVSWNVLSNCEFSSFFHTPLTLSAMQLEPNSPDCKFTVSKENLYPWRTQDKIWYILQFCTCVTVN